MWMICVFVSATCASADDPGWLLVSCTPSVPPPPIEYPPTVPLKVMTLEFGAEVNPAPQLVALNTKDVLHVTDDAPTVIVMKADASA